MDSNRIHYDRLDVSMDGEQATLWDGRRFDGVAYEAYPDGTAMTEATFVAGFPHGPERSWYPNAQLEQEGCTKFGTRRGVWRFWGEDGSLREVRDYELGIVTKTTLFGIDERVESVTELAPTDSVVLELDRRRQTARIRGEELIGLWAPPEE